MKKVFTTLLAVLFANIIVIQVARAAIYEAPFVGADGMVLGSEGKVRGEDKYWKVEILTEEASTTFAICAYDSINGPMFLADATTDEDGELKHTGTLLSGTYPGFSFVIYSTAGACVAGNERWISGFTLE
jgi:hypothetical protein